MKLSVPKEAAEGERRVALVPEVGEEAGRGRGRRRARAGRRRVRPPARRPLRGGRASPCPRARASRATWWPRSRRPRAEEIGRSRQGTVLIGFLQPLTAPDTARALADAGVTSFAMEAIPRITRAQSMDALSSPGHRGRLPRGADRRPGARALLPDAHHGGRHHPAGQGARARRRRGGPAGDRHRAPPGRRALRVRRALGRGGADPVARRQVREARHRPRGRRGRGRLRPRS